MKLNRYLYCWFVFFSCVLCACESDKQAEKRRKEAYHNWLDDIKNHNSKSLCFANAADRDYDLHICDTCKSMSDYINYEAALGSTLVYQLQYLDSTFNPDFFWEKSSYYFKERTWPCNSGQVKNDKNLYFLVYSRPHSGMPGMNEVALYTGWPGTKKSSQLPPEKIGIQWFNYSLQNYIESKEPVLPDANLPAFKEDDFLNFYTGLPKYFEKKFGFELIIKPKLEDVAITYAPDTIYNDFYFNNPCLLREYRAYKQAPERLPTRVSLRCRPFVKYGLDPLKDYNNTNPYNPVLKERPYNQRTLNIAVCFDNNQGR